MSDFLKALEAKSDQWNAADLVGVARTFTIVAVKINLAADQKVSVEFAESPDKVWRPCKGMGRVMAELWRTGEPQDLVGKRVSLFCDPDVTYGASTTGGIRISAMSDIAEVRRVNVKISRTKFKQYDIKPLVVQKPAPVAASGAQDAAAQDEARAAARRGTEPFRVWFKDNPAKRADVQAIMPQLKALCQTSDAAREADPFGLPPVDPIPAAPTDADIRAQIDADHQRDMTGGQA